jgi:hypothetical protein
VTWPEIPSVRRSAKRGSEPKWYMICRYFLPQRTCYLPRINRMNLMSANLFSLSIIRPSFVCLFVSLFLSIYSVVLFSYIKKERKKERKEWTLFVFLVKHLTLILLTWRIWWAPNNANKWQMGFNSMFKGLKKLNITLMKMGLNITSAATAQASWISVTWNQ